MTTYNIELGFYNGLAERHHDMIAESPGKAALWSLQNRYGQDERVESILVTHTDGSYALNVHASTPAEEMVMM